MMSLSEFKVFFDSAYLAYLEEKIALTKKTCSDDTLATLLHQVSLLAQNGKRIRPYLVYLMYTLRTTQNDPTPILRVSFAIELFHLFALVHDDIIDHGKFRHGVPTLHTFAIEYLHLAERTGDLDHVGRSHAMLLGDLLFSWTQALWLEECSTIPVANLALARQEFAAMSEEVLLGEFLDVDLTTRGPATPMQIIEKTYLKTATYTIIRPLRIGLACAAPESETASWCTAFGTHLGLAFQYQDDLLDVVGSSTVSKKPALQDVQEGQQTLLSAYVQEHGEAEDKACLRDARGVVLDTSAEEKLRELFTRTGAITHANEQIEVHLEAAKKLLAEASFFSFSERNVLLQFVDTLTGRTS